MAGDGGESRDHFDHGAIVSLDNSPTQNTPYTASQEVQKASAGPDLPNEGILNSTLPTGFLQYGQTGLTVEFMGSSFLSVSYKVTPSGVQPLSQCDL